MRCTCVNAENNRNSSSRQADWSPLHPRAQPHRLPDLQVGTVRHLRGQPDEWVEPNSCVCPAGIWSTWMGWIQKRRWSVSVSFTSHTVWVELKHLKCSSVHSVQPVAGSRYREAELPGWPSAWTKEEVMHKLSYLLQILVSYTLFCCTGPIFTPFLCLQDKVQWITT